VAESDPTDAEPAELAELAEFDEWLGADPTIDELDSWLNTLHGTDWRMACRTILALEDAQARLKALEDALAKLRLSHHKTLRLLQTVGDRILVRSAEVVELRAKLRKS
jgi:hypothetical protein